MNVQRPLFNGVYSPEARVKEPQRRDGRREECDGGRAQSNHLPGIGSQAAETCLALRPSCLCGLIGLSSTASFRIRISRPVLFSLGVLLALCALPAHASSSDSKSWRQLVEADWLAYEESLMATNPLVLVPRDDAAGGCDGVKDGGHGFHTEKQDQPWWQVDLGKRQPVARVVIWNRCDCPEPRHPAPNQPIQ